MPSKNEMAESLSRADAMRAGVQTFSSVDDATRMVTSNTRKLYGFTRKQLPPGLPITPFKYVYSVSRYGELVNLGVGFPKFVVMGLTEEDEVDNKQYGAPCTIHALYFVEEAQIDRTEFGPHTSQQIIECILQIGPGMNASNDRRRRGWFVSDHNPPKQEEVERAIGIYTAECRRLLAEGNAFHTANKFLEINELHREAAHYLKQRVPWDHGRTSKMVDCMGCGEPIKDGSIVHAPPQGCGAVQPGRWPDAVLWGLKRIEDVPTMYQDAVRAALNGEMVTDTGTDDAGFATEEDESPRRGRPRKQ
jgi:hypothetical protein